MPDAATLALRRTAFYLVAFVVSVVAAFFLAYREIDTVYDAWQTCHVGSVTAYQWSLGFLMMWMTAYNLVVLNVGLCVHGRGRVPVPAIVVVTGAVLLLSGWAVLGWCGLPVVTTACPGGEPGWWPAWLPPDPTHEETYP